jgi:prepilin-type N-terminal cleavage/methylation domain-containing protein
MKTSINNRSESKAFTLIELMVVILIVALLAAATIPILRGRIDAAKWAEANATAGMIRNAVRAHFAESGEGITGNLADGAVMSLTAIEPGDLSGTYFVAADYTIDNVDENGNATIIVTASQPNSPSGSRTLYPDGRWE